MKDKEKEVLENTFGESKAEKIDSLIDDLLDEDDKYMENYEGYSTHNCSICGARMTVEEFEEFEGECEACVWDDTSGLIDDNTEEEL